ncbi:MAG: hypothetical protein DMF84_13785 [Acidobacteria bacterium]|nr:MAG: hypothetical protein DMF84_13785 [Acidobacteriota bacterium]
MRGTHKTRTREGSRVPGFLRFSRFWFPRFRFSRFRVLRVQQFQVQGSETGNREPRIRTEN